MKKKNSRKLYRSIRKQTKVALKNILFENPNPPANIHFHLAGGYDQKDMEIITKELQKAQIAYGKSLNKKYGFKLYPEE